jgi:hypothetical protein
MAAAACLWLISPQLLSSRQPMHFEQAAALFTDRPRHYGEVSETGNERSAVRTFRSAAAGPDANSRAS